MTPRPVLPSRIGVLFITYQKVKEYDVLLEGTLLKPSMTVVGVYCPNNQTPTHVTHLLEMFAQLAPNHPSLFLSWSTFLASLSWYNNPDY